MKFSALTKNVRLHHETKTFYYKMLYLLEHGKHTCMIQLNYIFPRKKSLKYVLNITFLVTWSLMQDYLVNPTARL